MYFKTNSLVLILLVLLQLPTIANPNIESNKLALEKLASMKSKLKKNLQRKNNFLVLYGTHDLEITISENDIRKQKIYVYDVVQISKKEALFSYNFLDEDGTVSNVNQTGYINNKYIFFHWALYDVHSYYALQYKIKNNKLIGGGFEMLFSSLLHCDLSSTNTTFSCQVIDDEDMPPSLISPAKLNQ